MKTSILPLVAILAIANVSIGQTSSKPTTKVERPRILTAEDVKAVWIRRLVPPRPLDPQYHQTMRAYKIFMEDIKAGKKDLLAQETAASYNRNQAIRVGDTASASIYEAELQRIGEAKAAAAAIAAKQKQSDEIRNGLLILQSNLDGINSELRIANSR